MSDNQNHSDIKSTELTSEERDSLLRGPAAPETGDGAAVDGVTMVAMSEPEESLPTTVGNQVAGALINIYRDFAMRLARVS